MRKAIDDIPSGFTLRHTLRRHNGIINRIAWSPDGKNLASVSSDDGICIWDAETGHLVRMIGEKFNFSAIWSPNGQTFAFGGKANIMLWDAEVKKRLWSPNIPTLIIYSLAWSPDGEILASGGTNTIRLWSINTGRVLHSFEVSGSVNSLAWSPDGKILASGFSNNIWLWNMKTKQLLFELTGHSNLVYSLAWSPDGKILASSSPDRTIRFWNPSMGQQIGILEGHTDSINCVSFSNDGQFLASKSSDNTIRIWSVNTREVVAVLEEASSAEKVTSLAFHPQAPILATLGEGDKVIRIWDLDTATLSRTIPATSSVHYTNAKVVLVGDTGVGKSGLGLVLTGQAFIPTDSTHGRNVWTFDNREVELDNGRKESRETLLWDLAGQPGYRLIHQLHLNEVAVALLVFDARSETDPFAGVDHWIRALRMAQRVQGSSAIPMKRFLIAARIDRGGKPVSKERTDALLKEWGFDGYFETSAKIGRGIEELRSAIQEAIDWEALPWVSSTDLFQRIKAFLVSEKEDGRLLSACTDLYRTLLKSEKDLNPSDNLYAQFETCIGRVEAQGLIRRLSFGNLVLLQPELLDIYASALVNAVRDEPDGLGSIPEERVRACDFSMPKEQRIKDREQEELLLIAMVEDLLRYEIALREQGEDDAYLVFPAQSTRENPDLPNPGGKSVIFSFEGPVQSIYATLAVRISHTGLFIKKELWRNAVTYTTMMGGSYGIFLHNIGEGRAELTLFFDEIAKEETRFHFEEFIRTHLERRALPGTNRRRRIFVCSGCETPLDDLSVRKRRERGFDWMICGVCETRVSLLDREDRLTATPISLVPEMDRVADIQRDRSTATAILQGKVATRDFDVFLCYNSKDKSVVKEIGEGLKEYGILPWLDEWELPPGRPWQPLLEKQIGKIKSAAVFVSSNDLGPWESQEMYAFLSEFVNRGCPVIPVLLPDTPSVPKLPIFLRGMTWVDFRRQDPDPIKQLIWGITGERGQAL